MPGGTHSTEASNRGNVALAAAMMLAGLVVVGAVALTLAPTGSDGVTSPSADQADFGAAEEGLSFVFEENNDTLDPAYDPSFDPGPADPQPLDYDRIATMLDSQPFTDEQVVQIQSLLDSLARLDGPGTIASLEPVAAETRTGTLVRVGTGGPHDLSGVLVENATTVQDLQLHIERETLPTDPDNATTVSVGDWTLAAYHDTASDAVAYQVPDGDWQTTAPDENLRFLGHNGTVNGDPVPFEPGETPFTVALDPGYEEGVGVYGALNLVAGGTTPADVTGIDEENHQEVVTRPAFTATYTDATSTVTDRITIDTEYRAFEYDPGPMILDTRLNVTAEHRANLSEDGGAALDDEHPVWLPPNEAHPTNGGPTYDIRADIHYLNGTTTTVESVLATVSNKSDGEWTECGYNLFGGEQSSGCVLLGWNTPDDLDRAPVAAVETLASDDLLVEATVLADKVPALEENTTAEGPVDVRDPYVGTDLVAPEQAQPGDDVEIDLELEPRRIPDDNVTVGLTNGTEDTELSSTHSQQLAQALTEPLSLWSLNRKEDVTDALAGVAQLDVENQSEFLDPSLSPEDRAEMVVDDFDSPGPHRAKELMEFFDDDVTCNSCRNLTIQDLVFGLPEQYDEVPTQRTHTPQGVIGLLYGDHPAYDVESLQWFDRAEQVNEERTGIFESRLSDLGTEDYELTDPAMVDRLAGTLDWGGQDSTVDVDSVELFFQYIEWYTDRTAPLYEADVTSISQDLLDEGPLDPEEAPAGFPDHVDNAVADLAATTEEGGHDDPFRPWEFVYADSEDKRAVYLWLGGVDDSDTREDLLGIADDVEADGAAVDRDAEMLLEAVDTGILDDGAFSTGTITLGPTDELYGDWNLSPVGTYTGYDFATYSAADELTVTEPVPDPQAIDIELIRPYGDEIDTLVDEARFEGNPWDDPDYLTLYDEEPLVVDEPAEIETTVTLFDGSEVTNPSGVDYTVVGPAFEAPDCPEDMSHPDDCYPYDGPTDPDGFADITVSNGTHTLVGTTPTGMTQLYIDSQIEGSDDLYINETGPLRVDAEFGELNATTGNQSIVDVETSSTIDPLGASEFKSVSSSWGTPLYAGTADPAPEQVFAGAHSHPATPRVTYSVLHGPGDFSGVDNNDVPWQAGTSEVVFDMTEGDHDGFQATASTGVDFSSPSPLEANLTVTGPDGSVTSVTQRLYIEPSQGTPHVQPQFTADTLTPELGETVTFDASPTDASGATVYNWYIDGETITKEPGGGPGDWEPADPTLDYTFDESQTGPVNVGLVITTPRDTNLDFPYGPAERVVQVGETDSPQPVFDYSPVPAEDGWEVTFDASASTGDIESYTWEFSDGTSIEDAGPTVEFIPFFEEETLEWTNDLPDCSECETFYPGGASGVIASNNKAAGGTVKAVNLTESALLDTSASALPAEPVSFTPDTYTPSAEFALETTGGGGGDPPPDPPADPDWAEHHQVIASPYPGGIAEIGGADVAATTWNNEEVIPYEAPPEDIERGPYDEVTPESWPMDLDLYMEEGEDAEEYYAWINSEAVLADEDDPWALEDGWVDWRDDEECLNMSGCHDEPTALVDFTETAGIEWESELDVWDPEREAAIYEERADSDTVSPATRHSGGEASFDFSVEVGDDPLDRNTIDAIASIYATIDEDSHDSITEEIDDSTLFRIEIETADGGDPDP